MAATQEIGDQSKAERLALLGMELAARDIVARDQGGDGAAIVGGGDDVAGIVTSAR